jgi:hypothetical protein
VRLAVIIMKWQALRFLAMKIICGFSMPPVVFARLRA